MKEKRICLVFVGVTGVGWDSFGRPGFSEEASFVPHGLAILSSVLQRRGHQVSAIDLRRLQGWSHFDEAVMEADADVYGIGAMSVDFGVAVAVARRIRTVRGRRTRIALGGVHATVATADAERYDVFDHIVVGEGERSFPALVESLENSPRVVKDLDPEPIALDALPLPDRDLWDFQRGEMVNPFMAWMRMPFATILASRGCPHHCAFCQPAERAMFGDRVRRRSLDHIFLELRHLRTRYQVATVQIHDDHFPFAIATEFSQRWQDEMRPASFMIQARADVLVKHADALARLAGAGLRSVSIGLESGNDRVLKFLQKGTTSAQNREAMRLCRENGVRVFANVMLGIPTETPEEMADTVAMCEGGQPDHVSVAYFTPHPGTALWDYCRDQDLFLRTDPFAAYEGLRRNPTGEKIRGVDYREAERFRDLLCAISSSSREDSPKG